MRILIHAAGMARGGGLRHLEGLLSGLAERQPQDVEVRLVLRQQSGNCAAASAPRMPLHEIPERLASPAWSRLPIDNLWVPHLARKHHADVVVSLANFGPIALARPHIVFQTNALFFDRTPFEKRSWRRSLDLRSRGALASLAIRNASVVVTPSAWMGDLVRAAVPSAASRIRCLPHAVDARVPAARRRRGGTFVFLCPGVGASHKGLDVLVRAVAEMGAGPFRVRALGDDHDWPEGFAAARELKRRFWLDDRFEIEPEVPLSEMSRAYGEVDAVVYPTRCESFGFGLLEALHAGLPVVASDIPVNREIAGDAALYYESDSPTALATAMNRLRNEDGLSDSLVARAQARISAARWSWSRYADEFLALCDSAAREPR